MIALSTVATAIPQLSQQIPGPVTSDNNVIAILVGVGFLIITILLSIVGTLLKRQLDQVINTCQSITIQHAQCRETLSARFADRVETRDEFRRVYGKLDDIDSALAKGGLK